MGTRQKRALILDDEGDICNLIKHVLHQCGYSVLTYASPLETILFKAPDQCPMLNGQPELFDQNPGCAELIFTDIEMPDVSGLAFVKKLRSVNCKAQHIAIVSGNWTPENQQAAAALNCKTFSKPFALAEIRDWVSSLS